MKIHIEQLECLCVLEEPIMLNTQDPLIDKDTIIEEWHIEVLRKFRVEEIRCKKCVS